MDITVYNICEDILKRVCFALEGDFKKNYERELIKFLTTDYKQYDFMFEEYEGIKTIQQKKEYKAIMMLIIVSSSYKMTTEALTNNRSYEENLYQLECMDVLTPRDIYIKFKIKDNEIIEYIEDYYDYIYRNYIYTNDCLDSILKEKRLKNIIKINPFAIVEFINYIDPNDILRSERTLQDYLNIQENAIVELMEENGFEDSMEIETDELQETIIRMTEEKLDYDQEKIKKFYGYVFGNIYEALKAADVDFDIDKSEINQLISYLEEDTTVVEELIDRYYNDVEFFDLVSKIFLIANENILEEDLLLQRDKFKKTNGIEVEKKLNPYYDEDEAVYQKIKEQYY